MFTLIKFIEKKCFKLKQTLGLAKKKKYYIQFVCIIQIQFYVRFYNYKTPCIIRARLVFKLKTKS